jgi:glycine/D-amino acid oxidase-like deaminating enzyme
VTADVAVVGAGIVGAAVARELAVRGVSVVLVDRAGVSQGTTGLGEGNVLCCDKLPGPELDLTLHGLDVYDEIDERLGDVARIRRKGALLVHADAGTWAAEPARLAGMAGVAAERLTPEAVREAEPELDGSILGATHFPRDLQCDPAAIAHALAQEAAAAGARVRTGCAVERIVVLGGRVSGLETAAGPVACGAVVIAAGTWSAALAATAGLPLPVAPRKGQLVLLRAPRPGFVRHKVVEASYLAAISSADAELQVSTVIETTWSGDVLVGSSRERRGFDVEPDPAVSTALVERGARLFGAIRGFEPVDAWAGLRPWLPDHLPAIGPSDAAEGLWVATGHEGAGVALGPVTGRVLAQAYCGEPVLVDLTPFAPDRFARRPSEAASR